MKTDINKLKEMNVKVVPLEIKAEVLDKYAALKVWVQSRPEFFEIDWENKKVKILQSNTEIDLDKYNEQLLKMNLSLNYFQQCKFTVKSSLILREFFYNFGMPARWAMSNRVRINKETVASEEVLDIADFSPAYTEYLKAKEAYETTKDFNKVRATLPLSFQSTYMFTCSVKQFIKYLAVMYKQLSKLYPELWKQVYLTCWSNECLREEMNQLPKYFNCEENKECTDDNLYSLIGTDIIHENKEYKWLGKIGFNLESQLCRHEGIKGIGIIDFIKNLRFKSKVDDLNCSAQIPYWVHSCEDRLLEIIKVRTHWFAENLKEDNPNSWTYLIKRFAKFDEDGKIDLDKNKHLFGHFDKKGDFHPELLNRYDLDEGMKVRKGYDLYLPDAFVLEWKGIVLNRIGRDGDSFLNQLYLQHFEKGYIKDNPNNPYRKKWLEVNPHLDFDNEIYGRIGFRKEN